MKEREGREMGVDGMDGGPSGTAGGGGCFQWSYAFLGGKRGCSRLPSSCPSFSALACLACE